MYCAHSIFLLGYTKANIEFFVRTALKSKSPDSEEMIGFLTEFEEFFNKQVQAILLRNF
jgi:hypothetical protein